MPSPTPLRGGDANGACFFGPSQAGASQCTACPISEKRQASINAQSIGKDDEAKKAGALGGKLLGAGGGGFLLVYCPYNVKHQVARRLEAAGGQLMDWNFELRGAQSWICDEDRWDYRDIQVQMPDKEYTFHV